VGAGYFNDPSCPYATAIAVAGRFAACTVAGVTWTQIQAYLNLGLPRARATNATAVGSVGANSVTVASTAGISAGLTATGVGLSVSPAAVVASVNQLTHVVTFGAGQINTSPVSGAVTFSGSIIPYQVTHNMYVYFRHADVNSTVAFQPGGTRNWVRTLFYNPCSGTTITGAPIGPYVSPTNTGGCTSGGSCGPGGAPLVASAAGQTDITVAGIVPSYAVTLGGA
jgi:hypothetical protein